MPETIVVRSEHGLPYSKGVMAQELSRTGLAPSRAFELARTIERRLDERGLAQIGVGELRGLVEDVLLAEEGEGALRRYRDWRRLDRLDRPLVVLLAGTTGVGKSTIATMLAHRLGITRVIATDVIRQVLRAFFSYDFLPAVHYSAYEAGKAVLRGSGDPDLVGYLEQARNVSTGVSAIIDRACTEGTPLVVEGVHLVPGTLDPRLRERGIVVEAVIAVADEEMHRGHFSLRGGQRPQERYLAHFHQIRKLQEHLAAKAEEAGVAVIDNVHVDEALQEVMDLVLDAARRASPEEEGR